MTLMRKHWFYPYIVMSYIAVFLWLSGFQNSPVKAAHQTLIGTTWISTLVLACWVCYRPPPRSCVALCAALPLEVLAYG